MPPRQNPKRTVATEKVKTYGLSDNQPTQHLLDADTLIQSGDHQAALKEIDLIKFADLSQEQRSKYNLLEAEISLSMGDAEHALLMLETAHPKLLAVNDQINYYQSLAFAYALTGNVLSGVSARIKLGALLPTSREQQDNIISILNALSTLPIESLNAPKDKVDELAGWIELAKILKQRNQPGFDLSGQIRQWQQKYPGHTAKAEYLQAYLATAQSGERTEAIDSAQPSTCIAVLVPESGIYAQAGKAITEGLTAAYKLAASASSQLPLKFFDSEQGNITDIYKQAVAAGAKQVIGPLLKEQIQTLAESENLAVPVLALNYVENLSKANLYQFGLSPIDEASQLVLRARSDGRQNAVLLVPDNAQGQRIGHYLSTAWQKSGGTLTGTQTYDPKQHTISAALNDLFAPLTQQSKEQILLLSANPEQGRELAPQLKYYQNGTLAIYAMPNIYSGHLDPVADADMGAITFCDIPWLFADAYSGPLSQSALANGQNLSETQIRLLPLGIDAYNLLGRLDQLANMPYSGATGRLSLNSENRIIRKLVCARFKSGVPATLGFNE